MISLLTVTIHRELARAIDHAITMQFDKADPIHKCKSIQITKRYTFEQLGTIIQRRKTEIHKVELDK